MTRMVFFTLCCKSHLLDWVKLGLVVLAVSVTGLAHGQVDGPHAKLRVERLDDGVWLSAQLAFDLPEPVEDALSKGIPIHFVARAEVFRPRWYWSNKKVASAQRRMRLSFHPLTRRWKVNLNSGEAADQGLSLNQQYESLAEALEQIRRLSRWKVAEGADVEAPAKYFIEFRFELDLGQLPRPLQIGSLGQADWQISIAQSLSLDREAGP